jgi:hypothetical protein
MRILSVKVTAIRQKLGCKDLPHMIAFFALFPPSPPPGEFFELDWCPMEFGELRRGCFHFQ